MSHGHRKRARSLLPSLTALSVFAVSCVGPDEGQPAIEGQSASILNGTAIEAANSGIANVNGCTGTLLRNNWVLTAAHCIRLHQDNDYASASLGWVWDGVSPSEAASAAKVDAGGRLIIAGYTYGSTGTSKRLFLRRYTSAGALDTAFGSRGTVSTDISGSAQEAIEDLVTLADGRIVAAGYSLVSTRPTLTLVRYTARGALDTSFGTSGRVQTAFPDSAETWAYGIALDAAGKLLVAGRRRPLGSPSSAELALARYTASGALDTTFNGTGRVLTSFASDQLTAVEGRDLAIDGAGRILVVGFGLDAGGQPAAVVARYTASGALDPSFGGDGRITIPNARAHNVLLQATRILVGGEQAGSAAIWRLNADGALDTTFGVAGVSRPRWYVQDSSRVVGLALASDGRIRVGAGASVPYRQGEQVAYASLGANGELALDRTYPIGANGFVEAMLVGQTLATAMAVAGERVFLVGIRDYDNVPYENAAFAVVQPDRLTATLRGIPVSMGNQTFDADRAHLPPGSDDVALVHTPSGFTMNGSTSSYRFPGFYTASYDALVGTDARIKGYGNNVLDEDGNESGAGYLREGLGRVTSLDPRYVYLGYRPSPAIAQIGLTGDSGSGVFTLDGKLFGALSIGTNTTAYYVRADRFSSWAASIVGP